MPNEYPAVGLDRSPEEIAEGLAEILEVSYEDLLKIETYVVPNSLIDANSAAAFRRALTAGDTRALDALRWKTFTSLCKRLLALAGRR